jgi:hypothetical protein
LSGYLRAVADQTGEREWRRGREDDGRSWTLIFPCDQLSSAAKKIFL